MQLIKGMASHKINSMLEDFDGIVPGIAVMAINKGEVVYRKESGLANLEYKIPIRSNTVFNIASISKQFTAMLVMILVEKGCINYDDYIINYLPEFSHYCSKVTVRHLLNNTSGIENYYALLDRLEMPSYNISNKEIYNLIKQENKLKFEPGSCFDYSNTNYVLLALIIEKLTKLSYSKSLHKYILDRVGMSNTTVYDEKQPIIANRAYGYQKEDDRFYSDNVDALTVGDGGVFSTIDDLFLWDQVLYTEKLVSNETMMLAFTEGKGKNGHKLEESYGFGWSVNESNNSHIVWHTGLDAGFRSIITRYLSQKFSVIILSNSTACTWECRKKVTDLLFEIFV